MKLPNGELAYVDRIKITGYLLSHSHPDGQGKAAFFTRFGFASDRWEELAAALRVVGTQNEVASEAASPYGVRYTVDGLLPCPDGRTPRVRTVWIVEVGTDAPRLVTAHPV